MVRVLVVDDEPSIRRAVGTILRRLGCDVVPAEDGVEAIEKLGGDPFDLVITDLRMPRADGFAVLNAIRDKRLSAPAIMLTADGSVADCVTAMKAGAVNFLSKPFNNHELERIVRDALGTEPPPGAESLRLRPHPNERPQVGLIGTSAKLRAVLDTVEQLADSDATVLLTGETGTGKEVVSRLLHGVSRRATHPFVPVNCGAIPEGTGESELFGHAEGAFAGATKRRTGRFLDANGGTLFLDEVGDLSLPIQSKLLRVIQDRQVTPLGESDAQAVDIRLVAATHRDLEAMARDGTFREDLYYRLNVVTIELPPLRARVEDIPPLIEYFLDASGRRAGKLLRLDDDALSALMVYPWPGNVRELENLVERLVILHRGGAVTVGDLPPKILGLARPSWPGRPSPGTMAVVSAAQPPVDVRAATVERPSLVPPGLAEGAVVQNRFRLLRKIGEGGSASVYRARDLELDTDVAIKFLARSALDDGVGTRFKQEVAILRKLNHRNIVRMFEFGTYEDYKFFVMELLEGRDLGARLKDAGGPLPISEAIDYLVQACLALDEAHKNGITHRDIKPENLFITRDGVLKVMDFGIAKRMLNSDVMTRTGWLAGTPEYMAPEQIAGFSQVTHSADIYSLGCVAYRMLTGHPPFTHREVFPLLFMHASTPPEALRPSNPDLSPELESLVLRLLAKTPEDRVASCGELADALGALRPTP